jgi:hypothetical protein
MTTSTIKPTRSWRAALVAAALIGASMGADASAQAPRTTPGDFTRALAQLLPRTTGAQPEVTGRQLDLPPLAGNARRAAFVLAEGAEVDANDAPSFELLLVVLVARDGAWHPQAAVPAPMDSAPFLYEDEAPLMIARVEDVDDDGEGELFVVARSNTPVECGTGYCTERRTLVFDIGDATPVLTANLPTSLDCQADSSDRLEGTVLIRDTDGDGHRDLVVRRRTCPGAEWDEASGGLVSPRCAPAVLTTWRWNAADDRYVELPSGL